MTRRARPSLRLVKPATLETDLETLGLTFPGLVARNRDHAVELLEEWKSGTLKTAWKKAARSSHPDHHPDDPGAQARFEECRGAFERLSELKVPKPRATVHRVPTLAEILREDGAVMEALRNLRPMDSKERRARRARANAGKKPFLDPVTIRFTSIFDTD